MFILELKNFGQEQIVGKLYVIGDLHCALSMAGESIKKIRCDEVCVINKKNNNLIAVMKKTAMERDLDELDEEVMNMKKRSVS